MFFLFLQISVMQELLASLGPQIEEAAGDVTRMMHMIEKVKPLKINTLESDFIVFI